MSTIRTLLFAVSALSGFGMAPANVRLQSGTGPIKVLGPAAVAASSSRAHGAKPDVYTYTVEVNSAPAYNTAIDVYDETGSLVAGSPVIVLAGHTTADFEVEAVTPGYDTLTASNANSSASMEVTIY